MPKMNVTRWVTLAFVLFSGYVMHEIVTTEPPRQHAKVKKVKKKSQWPEYPKGYQHTIGSGCPFPVPRMPVKQQVSGAVHIEPKP